MENTNIIADYSINLCCQFMIDKQYTIQRIPLYAEVRNGEGNVIGYRQMSNEEIDENIWLCDEEGNDITLADFKRKYILSLT